MVCDGFVRRGMGDGLVSGGSGFSDGWGSFSVGLVSGVMSDV